MSTDIACIKGLRLKRFRISPPDSVNGHNQRGLGAFEIFTSNTKIVCSYLCAVTVPSLQIKQLDSVRANWQDQYFYSFRGLAAK